MMRVCELLDSSAVRMKWSFPRMTSWKIVHFNLCDNLIVSKSSETIVIYTAFFHKYVN